MVKELEKNIWLLQIPLPKSPLKIINSYLIKGEDTHLLIDTGFNCEESEKALMDCFRQIGVDKKDIDIFITHSHSDHSGLAGKMIERGRNIYCSRTTYNNINNLTDLNEWQKIFTKAEKLGFEKDLSYYLNAHPGFKYSNSSKIRAIVIDEGHRFQVGDYNLECIAAPGHDPGMLCLYEKNNRLLFSGDHILSEITPNISCWSITTNPLSDYLNSLKKIKELPIDKIFPSHRSILENSRKRVNELEKHSLERIIEVENILKKYNEQTAYQVATKLKWKIPVKSWKEVNPGQKWFATGEAMAYLAFLYSKDRITLNSDDSYLFKINRNYKPPYNLKF